jgi:hypothetical protein
MHAQLASEPRTCVVVGRRSARLMNLCLFWAGVSLLANLLPGCGTTDGVVDDGRFTMNANLNDDDGDGVVIVPPGSIDDNGEGAFSFAPVFCCNPLSIDFSVNQAIQDLAVGGDYQWDFGDDRTGTGPIINHTYSWAGEYLVTLRVVIPGGETFIFEEIVDLGDPIVEEPDGGSDNQNDNGSGGGDSGDDGGDDGGDGGQDALTVSAGQDQEVLAGGTVTLQGIGIPADGPAVLQYVWSQVSGPAVSLNPPDEATTTFTAPAAGGDSVTLVFRLTVYLGSISAQDEVQVTVLSEAPTVGADAGPNQNVEAGELVVLDGRGSSGQGDLPLHYEWVQVSGPTVELLNAEASLTGFAAPSLESGATIVFELTVTQGPSADTDEVTIVVAASDDGGGQGDDGGSGDDDITVHADAGDDQQVDAAQRAVLDGTDSSGSGDDPLEYAWAQTSGISVTLEDTDQATASFVAPNVSGDPAILVFTLTVTQQGVVDTDQVTVVVLPAASGGEDLPSDEQVLTWMQELDPLQKVHFTFPLPAPLQEDPNHMFLYDLVRLTHAFSVSGEWFNQHRINTGVQVCEAINDTNPAIRASIAVNYHPWIHVFPDDAPPTYVGWEHQAEIDQFAERMTLLRDSLATANAQYHADVELTAVILDSEHFIAKDPAEPDADEWNAAIDAKYMAFHNIAASVFPDARIEWYGRGAYQVCEAGSGWCLTPWFTLNTDIDRFNCALYRVPEIEATRETFRRTYDNAVDHGYELVTPWVALASGYRRDAEPASFWEFDWNYDLVYSWQLGAELNHPWYGDHPERYAPWDAATAVIMYPPPFDQRVPAWGVHFVAYVRGAHQIEELP